MISSYYFKLSWRAEKDVEFRVLDPISDMEVSTAPYEIIGSSFCSDKLLNLMKKENSNRHEHECC